MRTIAAALNLAFQAMWFMGYGAEAHEIIHAAIARLRREKPTDEFACALAWASCAECLREDWESARSLSVEANTVAEQVGDPFAIALAREWRGLIKAMTGESDGVDDLEPASKAFTELGSSMAAQGRHQLAVSALVWQGAERACSLYREGADFARRTRALTWEMQARGELTLALFDVGGWDEVIEVADEILSWETTIGEAYPALYAAQEKARVVALRGDVPRARMTMSGILDRSRAVGDPQVLAPALTISALIGHLDGNDDLALGHLDALGRAAVSPIAPITEIARLQLSCGAVEAARRLVTMVRCRPPRTQHALATIHAGLVEADGVHTAAAERYADAAERWRHFGNPFELAHALAGLGRTLESLGEGGRAAAASGEARTIFEGLGVAGPALPAQPAETTPVG